MPVNPVKSETRCKVCASEHRAEIDALLEKRAAHDKGEDGKVVTQSVVLARMAELGIDNPTKENITVHWAKHCEVVADTADVDSHRKQMEAIFAGALGENWRERVVRPDEALPLIANYLWQQIADQMMTGNRAGGLVETYQKVCAEMNRRKSDGAAKDLAELFGAAAEAGAED